ncbi:sensor histidine kinase [Natronogracilivirga saccharolytica]|uniref:histidine kinase n=1 Tax=Natronogracilivirga saccharolytica TaxID=2812953 RepID=A0A8J7UTY5_9BACT|nr:HAMP domain-containing sensor histidine kinase [Natronogracilivirga saccharolytica]MBP3191840.1 HAMP domain-containing histidine kinase [Natronogracilivirga saccharolytica]
MNRSSVHIPAASEYDSGLMPGWHVWQNDQALRGMTLKMVPLIGVLVLFMYTDYTLLHNLTVSLIRLIPIALAATLLFFNLTTEGYQTQKRHLYNVLLISLLLMMFVRVILLDDNPEIGGSLAGLLLVVLVLSLELRTNLAITMGVYLLSPVVFTFFAFYPENVWDISYFNIYPMMIAGLLFNIIQSRYSFQTFKSQYMLGVEKQRAEALYRETKEHNEAINRANLMLRDSEKTLKETLQTREKLISIIAHDLRNPFNTITGYSDIISTESDNLTRQEISDYARMINKSSHNTLNLIDNLLSWARSQTGKIALDPRPHSVPDLLNDVIDVISVQADAKNISFDPDMPADLIVEMDYATMSAVFRNLLSNAIKFTPQNGKIAISADKEYDHDGNATSISVKIRDTGAGFSGEHLDDLIKEGKAASRPGTDNEKGTGLGLMICHDFTERNSGTLSARNIPDGGSEFTVTLPYRLR